MVYLGIEWLKHWVLRKKTRNINWDQITNGTESLKKKLNFTFLSQEPPKVSI